MIGQQRRKGIGGEGRQKDNYAVAFSCAFHKLQRALSHRERERELHTEKQSQRQPLSPGTATHWEREKGKGIESETETVQ